VEERDPQAPSREEVSVKIIWLDPRDEEELRWHRDPEESPPTRYIDGDGFNEISIVAVEDTMSDRVVATVLFAGTPVLIVSSGDVAIDDWSYVTPDYGSDRGANAQSYAAFMVQIGEFDEEAPAYVADHGLAALYDGVPGPTGGIVDIIGDGHEVTTFVDMVARAVHREWPDSTPEVQL
jgi:hypothetical protein